MQQAAAGYSAHGWACSLLYQRVVVPFLEGKLSCMKRKTWREEVLRNSRKGGRMHQTVLAHRLDMSSGSAQSPAVVLWDVHGWE